MKNATLSISTILCAVASALTPCLAAAKADGPSRPVAPQAAPSVASSSVAIQGATVAPERTIGMIDVGTRFTLLKNFVLPPQFTSVELARFGSYVVSLRNLNQSTVSQIIPAGTEFISDGVPSCGATGGYNSGYSGSCTISLAGGVSIQIANGDRGSDYYAAQAVVHRTLARVLSEGMADSVAIQIPAPVRYGQTGR